MTSIDGAGPWWCRTQLAANIGNSDRPPAVIPTYRLLPPQREYDLVIVDGGGGRGVMRRCSDDMVKFSQIFGPRGQGASRGRPRSAAQPDPACAQGPAVSVPSRCTPSKGISERLYALPCTAQRGQKCDGLIGYCGSSWKEVDSGNWMPLRPACSRYPCAHLRLMALSVATQAE